ncbi:hypothetical protein SAMN04487970_101394 [Paenibacillus tianmuensis]|uniref:Uncharacterized protein n=1 Tax=Paenibacillus tianmuensis TaxID=624147 RepID=A0A1G4R9U6_9BACL|nr:hypothetical protein [Paenibacillus tianmuensis]SCW53568.1 hypothetical protein SAMN04487970_101394 [Paenibacillus tianmuensis]
MISTLKTKITVLALCSAFLLPTATFAQTADEPAANPQTTAITFPNLNLTTTVSVTNVNGILVPGDYVITSDSRVVYIPEGVGLVVVNKETALPSGAFYLQDEN